MTAPEPPRQCPACQRQVARHETICPYCGHLFIETTSTDLLDDNESQDIALGRLGTARFNQKMRLLLRLNNGKTEFSFDPSQIEALVLGRRDPITGEAPTVDLADYDAETLGVSRRHATIRRGETNALSVLDHGSVNGTFINGQRLIPDQARILRDGDELRLGRLVLRVFFQPLQ